MDDGEKDSYVQLTSLSRVDNSFFASWTASSPCCTWFRDTHYRVEEQDRGLRKKGGRGGHTASAREQRILNSSRTHSGS